MEGKPLSVGSMVEFTRERGAFTGRRFSSLNVDELIELEASKAYKPTFIWRVVRSRGKAIIQEYAAKKRHSSGWVYRQEKEMENSQFNDYIIK